MIKVCDLLNVKSVDRASEQLSRREWKAEDFPTDCVDRRLLNLNCTVDDPLKSKAPFYGKSDS